MVPVNGFLANIRGAAATSGVNQDSSGDHFKFRHVANAQHASNKQKILQLQWPNIFVRAPPGSHHQL
jgi:hypothetical protein